MTHPMLERITMIHKGYLDDALMMGLCLKFCHDDVESYKKWQDDQYVNVN